MIIACGSEAGTTMVFAKALLEVVITQGIKAHLIEMNAYESFPAMRHLLLLTSTHGVGGAPFNALKFIEKFRMIGTPQSIKYSVVGFGSKKYRTFCQYAETLSFLMKSTDRCTEWIPLTKVSDQSPKDFGLWYLQFSARLEGQLSLGFDYQ